MRLDRKAPRNQSRDGVGPQLAETRDVADRGLERVAAGIHGADIDGDNASWCGQNLGINTRQIPLSPPTDYPDSWFDLIFGISVFTHLGGCVVAVIALWMVRAKRGSWLPSLIYFVILQQITRFLTVPGPYTNVNVAHFAYGGMKDWFGSYWTYWLANTAAVTVTLWVMDWGLAKLFPPHEK